MTLPLSTGFTVSHRFWVVVFSFSFISMHILISSVICCLFRSVLFSLHMFVFLIVFFLFSSVQSLSRVRLFATPGTVARHTSLSITNSQSSLKLISIESVMPSSHLILCCPLLLLPPIPPSIKVFSDESTLHNPTDCSPPGFSAHGIFQARVLEWGAIAFSNTLLNNQQITE